MALHDHVMHSSATDPRSFIDRSFLSSLDLSFSACMRCGRVVVPGADVHCRTGMLAFMHADVYEGDIHSVGLLFYTAGWCMQRDGLLSMHISMQPAFMATRLIAGTPGPADSGNSLSQSEDVIVSQGSFGGTL